MVTAEQKQDSRCSSDNTRARYSDACLTFSFNDERHRQCEKMHQVKRAVEMSVKSLHRWHRVGLIFKLNRTKATITGSPQNVCGVKEKPEHNHSEGTRTREPISSCVATECRSFQEVTTNSGFYKWNKNKVSSFFFYLNFQVLFPPLCLCRFLNIRSSDCQTLGTESQWYGIIKW